MLTIVGGCFRPRFLQLIFLLLLDAIVTSFFIRTFCTNTDIPPPTVLLEMVDGLLLAATLTLFTKYVFHTFNVI